MYGWVSLVSRMSLEHNSAILAHFNAFGNFYCSVLRFHFSPSRTYPYCVHPKCLNLACNTIEIFEWNGALTYAHLIGVILSFSEITFRLFCISFSFISLFCSATAFCTALAIAEELVYFDAAFILISIFFLSLILCSLFACTESMFSTMMFRNNIEMLENAVLDWFRSIFVCDSTK